LKYFDRKFFIVEGSIGEMVMYVNPVPRVERYKEKIRLKRGIEADKRLRGRPCRLFQMPDVRIEGLKIYFVEEGERTRIPFGRPRKCLIGKQS
jgi:hypothetical protein